MSYNLRFFAVRTASRREKRVAEDITKVSKRIGLEIGQVLFHPKTAGYVYVECAGPRELENILELVPSSKGIVGEISPGEVQNLFDVKATENPLREYDHVVISQGPEKGLEGLIEVISGAEAVILIDDPIMPRRITVPYSWLLRK